MSKGLALLRQQAEGRSLGTHCALMSAITADHQVQ